VTVQQLIAKLATLDPALVVTVECEVSGSMFPHPLTLWTKEQVASDGTRLITIGQTDRQYTIPFDLPWECEDES
jgi:hypothetical protein